MKGYGWQGQDQQGVGSLPPRLIIISGGTKVYLARTSYTFLMKEITHHVSWELFIISVLQVAIFV